MTAALLGLAASLGWGISDFLGGFVSRRARLVEVLLVAQVTGLVVILLVLAARAPALPSMVELGWSVATGFAGAVGIAGLYRALKIGSMSLVAPITALAVLVPVMAGVIGGERPALLVALGLVVAICGSALAGWAPGAADTRGLGTAIVAALGFGFGFVFIDRAAEGGVLWAFTGARVTSTLLLGAIALIALGGLPRMSPSTFALSAGTGLVESAAGVSFAAATTIGLLSVVSVLASLYPVVTIGLAFVVLRERLGPAQWTAVILVLSGVVAITMG